MKLSPRAAETAQRSKPRNPIAEFFRTVESPYQRPGDLLEDRDA